MTLNEAKAVIYANVVYACEKAGLAPQTTRLVQDACDTIIAIADACETIVALADRKTENSSEKPNNCEDITEDGVTCARYPACDDCPDNPLNKVKGSERLVKGSEHTDCKTCKWWSSYGYCVHRECKGYEPEQTERSE